MAFNRGRVTPQAVYHPKTESEGQDYVELTNQHGYTKMYPVVARARNGKLFLRGIAGWYSVRTEKVYIPPRDPFHNRKPK